MEECLAIMACTKTCYGIAFFWRATFFFSYVADPRQREQKNRQKEKEEKRPRRKRRRKKGAARRRRGRWSGIERGQRRAAGGADKPSYKINDSCAAVMLPDFTQKLLPDQAVARLL